MALIDNLIAYWPLDEASGNAIDAHGSNNLAETSGTIDATTGKVNGCRDLEGGDTEHFAHTQNADLTVGDIDFSFQIWINPESITSGAAIIDRWTAAFDLLLRWSGSQLELFISNGSSFASVTASNFGNLSMGTWYCAHFGHSAAANDIWIAVNAGTPNTTSYSSGGNSTATHDFNLGGSAAQGFYDGLMDEVGFWKRDIRADIAELYNSGNGRDYAYIAGGAPPATNRRRRVLICGAQG